MVAAPGRLEALPRELEYFFALGVSSLASPSEEIKATPYSAHVYKHHTGKPVATGEDIRLTDIEPLAHAFKVWRWIGRGISLTQAMRHAPELRDHVRSQLTLLNDLEKAVFEFYDGTAREHGTIDAHNARIRQLVTEYTHAYNRHNASLGLLKEQQVPTFPWSTHSVVAPPLPHIDIHSEDEKDFLHNRVRALGAMLLI